ncbi:MAG: LysR family transcriptional regulator [Deltaproteobacteria bacterium]|nr:LysR family transcriptional regulator [Deltaproteobacteria bacterium]
MNAAPLGSLNLNLLRTLDVLLDECNVTRAAERLGVTQSAVSHALRQLRRRIGDPLLVRVGLTMQLTARAEALRVPLRRGLSALEQALEGPSEFDPAEARGWFDLAAPEDLALVLLPTLSARLAKQAPSLALRWRPLAEALDASEHASGGVGLSLTPAEPEAVWSAPGLSRRKLYRERVVCVMREHHPLASRKLNRTRYLAARHIQCANSASAMVDRALSSAGVDFGVVAGSATMAAEIAALSDMLLTIPRRLAEHLAARHRLLLRPFPMADLRYKVRMHWHPSQEDEPTSRLVRDLLEAIVE